MLEAALAQWYAPPSWKVGCMFHSHWMTCRSAFLARAFTSTTKQEAQFRLRPAADSRHQN